MSVVSVLADNPPLKAVPARYVTTENYQLANNEYQVFRADIDCDRFKQSDLTVCAELPSNWPWDPYHGFVYLNLFNKENDTTDVSRLIV